MSHPQTHEHAAYQHTLTTFDAALKSVAVSSTVILITDLSGTPIKFAPSTYDKVNSIKLLPQLKLRGKIPLSGEINVPKYMHEVVELIYTTLAHPAESCVRTSDYNAVIPFTDTCRLFIVRKHCKERPLEIIYDTFAAANGETHSIFLAGYFNVDGSYTCIKHGPRLFSLLDDGHVRAHTGRAKSNSPYVTFGCTMDDGSTFVWGNVARIAHAFVHKMIYRDQDGKPVVEGMQNVTKDKHALMDAFDAARDAFERARGFRFEFPIQLPEPVPRA
jgi:hypothetical protein